MSANPDNPRRLDAKTFKALQSIANGKGKPCRLATATLLPLRLNGYAYTGHRNGRTFAHLTARGREAIGLDRGLCK